MSEIPFHEALGINEAAYCDILRKLPGLIGFEGAVKISTIAEKLGLTKPDDLIVLEDILTVCREFQCGVIKKLYDEGNLKDADLLSEHMYVPQVIGEEHKKTAFITAKEYLKKK